MSPCLWMAVPWMGSERPGVWLLSPLLPSFTSLSISFPVKWGWWCWLSLINPNMTTSVTGEKWGSDNLQPQDSRTCGFYEYRLLQLTLLGEKINQGEECGMHRCLTSTSIHSCGQIPSLHHSEKNKLKISGNGRVPSCTSAHAWLFSMGR